MNETIERTGQFLARHKISAEAIEMEPLMERFSAEMERGLAGDEQSSLKMIPTYTPVVDSLEVGKPVIVLDAGGTNLRSCIVEFDEEGKAQISDFRKTTMPGFKREVSGAEFFSVLADETERLIDRSDRIGFCFSYAAEILANHDGVPLIFSKEIKAPEVIGKPVGANLLRELARRGHDVSSKRVAVLNDTVATLLAGVSAKSEVPYSGYVGFILGTGTNTAYVEDHEKITKLSLKPGRQIINVESGNFDFCPGEVDRAFFDSTEHPHAYHLEKMISGAYLGPLAAMIIGRAIEEGVLSNRFAQRFSAIGPLSTTVMSNYLEMPFNEEYALVSCVKESEDDAQALWMIVNAIIDRAAKLTAANLAATILKRGAGTDPRRPVLINADGTTFYKTEYLKLYTEFHLKEHLQDRHRRYYRFTQIADSPTIGAAIAALGV
ncbi:MAG: hexokinase [Sphaerochaeta sp.]|jgi:hexokinase|nr:hexokinase [Sphaerochaeta sp.]MDX9914601.1 hexokinase [Sphaerochaeta sp.]